MSAELIGWLSSFVLVLTLGRQVLKQWREGSSDGVSKWLFIGQMAASTGFLVYSVHTGSYVFIVTNGLLLVNALVGFGIHRKHQRRHARGA